MSIATPIYDSLGSELEDNRTSQLETMKNSESAGAFAIEAMQASPPDSLRKLQTIASAQSHLNNQEYLKHLVDYVEDWENSVTTIIDQQKKKVRELKTGRTHYEKKVDNLRQKVNDKSSPALVEKVSRNEVKLKEAFLLHETEADRLCTLIEAATGEGWKDLYILAKNFMKFESNRVGRDSDLYSHLSHILESMKIQWKRNCPPVK